MKTHRRNEESTEIRNQRYLGNVKFTLATNNLGNLPSAKAKSEQKLFVGDICHMPATISCLLE
eukprot:14183732-Alexandrium_andersonii.AAC.1